MKADLYIGDDVRSVELVAAPRLGDLVIFGGVKHSIREIGHDVDKRKLQVVCEKPEEDAIAFDGSEFTDDAE